MKQNKQNSQIIHIRPGFMMTATIIFGSIGLHDFVIKKWVKGFLHILLVLIPLAFALLKYNPLNLDAPVMPNILFWTSYCWGIIELYLYLKKVKLQTEPEVVIDYNTFVASNRIFLFIFAIVALIEVLLLFFAILAIITPSIATHDGHFSVLNGLVLILVLAIHGIIAIITACFFNYSRKLKSKLDHMRCNLNQRERKIYTIIDFSYHKIIKPSIKFNIGLLIICISLLSLN